MRLSEVKKNLDSTGLLDDRQLFSYATCAGTLLEKAIKIWWVQPSRAIR